MQRLEQEKRELEALAAEQAKERDSLRSRLGTAEAERSRLARSRRKRRSNCPRWKPAGGSWSSGCRRRTPSGPGRRSSWARGSGSTPS
ncbi:hypothetical protein LJK88_40070 [Paenibacillus sp. P26]|nr:hypothetical protein LJK88_40070 [Paenibacillus sp. P26]